MRQRFLTHSARNASRARNNAVRQCSSQQSIPDIEMKYPRMSSFLDMCQVSSSESSLIWSHIQAMHSSDLESDEPASKRYKHVHPWMIAREANRPIKAEHEGQKHCSDIIPGLAAQPWWDSGSASDTTIDWMTRMKQVLESRESVDIVRGELTALMREDLGHHRTEFQRYTNAHSEKAADSADGKIYSTQATDQGHWNVLYLSLHQHDESIERNRQRFPMTLNILDQACEAGGRRLFPHVLVSCLTAGSHVIPHFGPTNKKLRMQLPLMVPGFPLDWHESDDHSADNDDNNGSFCSLRVSDEIRDLQPGKLICFDDSFEHEAWNRHSSLSRMVLIFDVWHPDLSEEEIELLDSVQKVFERKLLQMSRRFPDATGNPYAQMAQVQRQEVDHLSVWGDWFS